jgi:hypothetical protein
MLALLAAMALVWLALLAQAARAHYAAMETNPGVHQLAQGLAHPLGAMDNVVEARALVRGMAQAVNAIRTEVTLLLRGLRPEQHLSFTELWIFDVDTFVFDGHAQRTARADVPPLFRIIRDETNTRLEEDVRALLEPDQGFGATACSKLRAVE